MLMLAGASAFAVTDGQTYESVDGINCENLWVFDRFHAEEAYMGNPIANKDARTATTDGTTVYVGVSGETATIEKFDLKTGAYLGSLALTKGGRHSVASWLSTKLVLMSTDISMLQHSTLTQRVTDNTRFTQLT